MLIVLIFAVLAFVFVLFVLKSVLGLLNLFLCAVTGLLRVLDWGLQAFIRRHNIRRPTGGQR
jgi:hypothetical protein